MDDLIMRERKEEEARLLQARFRNAYLWLSTTWGDGLKAKTLENFDAFLQRRAVEAANLFLSDLNGTLIFYGPFGVGKTHLLAAICNRLVHSGETPRFATSPNLFAAIQHRVRNNQDYNDIIVSAATSKLLILDDVDKAKWSDFREEIYFAIIDTRVNRGLPTALSTNRLTELAGFMGGAAASRLSVGQLAVEMKGEDYRPRVK